MTLAMADRAMGQQYIAVVTKSPPLTSLLPGPELAPTGYYSINYFNFAGGRTGRTFYSPNPLYVAAAPRGDGFLVLADRNGGQGSEIFRADPLGHAKTIRKFQWRAFNTGFSAPPGIMVGADGVVWIWFESTATKRTILRIFGPQLRRQLGMYALPSGSRYLGFNSVLSKGREVALVASARGGGMSRCSLLVVQENGRSQLTPLPNVIGSYPQYLAAVGDSVIILTQDGKMIRFHVLPMGEIKGVRIMDVIRTPPKQFPVTAFAVLNHRTAFYETVTSHTNGSDYRLFRFSLKTGKVEKSIHLSSEIQRLSVLAGRLLAVTSSGGITTYTPSLQHVHSFRPYQPYLEGLAASPTR
jgi:hypothetical protein